MFSTHAVMFSPYNYHWYRPSSARKVWRFHKRPHDNTPSLWRGKSYYYSNPNYARWVWAVNYVIDLKYACKKDDLVWQMQALAFVQGSHPRLGAESLVRLLDPLMLQRVLPRPYNG